MILHLCQLFEWTNDDIRLGLEFWAVCCVCVLQASWAMLRTSAVLSSSGICRITTMISSSTQKFTSTQWRGWGRACSFSSCCFGCFDFYIFLSEGSETKKILGNWIANYLCWYRSWNSPHLWNKYWVGDLGLPPLDMRSVWLSLSRSVAESKILPNLGSLKRKKIGFRPCYLPCCVETHQTTRTFRANLYQPVASAAVYSLLALLMSEWRNK